MKARRNGAVALTLAGVVAGMVGLAYASVPLYRLFCQVTGFGGTTQRADASQLAALSVDAEGRSFTVRFDANVNSQLPWRFEPVQHEVSVKAGEPTLAFYRAVNVSDVPVTGTATFNVNPPVAGPHFVKVDCFCFAAQTLKPGEAIEMPVSFYIDPSYAKDREMGDVKEIVLSYTFFRMEGAAGKQAAKQTASGRGTNATN